MQRRDSTWVGGALRASVVAAESERVGADEPVNIGTGQEVSIKRSAELIGGPVIDTPPRGFDEPYKRVGIERLREVLGCVPQVQIDEGVQRLLDAANCVSV